MEHADVRQREPQRGEGGLHQPCVLPVARRVPHDLAVVQVDQQADVVPLAADADVREVADYVGAREVAVELPVEHVGGLGLVHLGGVRPVLLAGIRAGQAFLVHYPLYAPPGGDHALLGERALYLRGAVLAAVPLIDPDDVGCYGVVGGLGLGVRQHPVVRGPGHAEHAAHG